MLYCCLIFFKAKTPKSCWVTLFEVRILNTMFFTKWHDIDKQLQELNSRFSEQAIYLLTLSCALSPEDKYKAFDVDTILSQGF